MDASFTGNLAVSGTSSLTGNITAGNIDATGKTVTAGTITDGTLSVNSGSIGSAVNGTFSGTVQAQDLTATATITGVTGNITTVNATTVNSTSAALTGALTVGTTAGVTGNLTAGNISTATATITTGAITTVNATTLNGTNAALTGNITAGGTVGVTGNLTAGNISTATATITTGDITTVNATDINASGTIDSTSTDASTTTATGAIITAGGIGIAGNINVGGAKSQFTNTTVSTSSTTGAVVVAGGVGIAGVLSVANISVNTNTIASINTNGAVNIQPNGTGKTIINGGGNGSDTAIGGASNANVIYVDASNDNVGIKTATPHAGSSLHVNSTDSIIIPTGTTAQRPATNSEGMIRFNTDTSAIEYYDSAEWTSLASDFTVISSQAFAGDGSTVAYTLTEEQTTASCIVSINGIVQAPAEAYSVSGTTLTFTEAPSSIDSIEVRKITTTTTITNISDSVNGYAAMFAVPAGIELFTGASSRDKAVTIDNDGQLYVLATTASSSVTTGALVVDGGVGIAGNLFVGGDITAAGNINFGDNATDTVSFTAAVSSHVIPETNVTYDLGSDTKRWRDLYLSGSTIALGNITIKDVGGTVGFFAADGTTPATIDSASVDTTTIANGTSNVAVATVNGSIVVDVAGATVGTFSASGLAANVTGALTGNASTATSAGKWTTARTITLGGDLSGSVSVDGSGDVTLTAAVTVDAVALGTNTTGNYVQQAATSGNGISGSVNSEGGTFTVTSNATNANTANSIVYRDASGNFSAGTITAALSGNASSATTAGTISGQANSATITAASANTANNIVQRNASGNFSAGTITAALSGNASSATTAGTITGQANSATITATSANTANNIVLRDASGNFSAGTITATSTGAQYADLAENYVGDAAIEPGTVVEFGGDKEVTACGHDMCTRVAGVVSTNPAYLMNVGLEAEHVVAVAFTGRVPCKVVGPVRKGDMMVSAGNGAARAEAEPKVGSIIGKALENFDGAEGVIEVVVGRY